MPVSGILWGRRQNLSPFRKFLIANGIRGASGEVALSKFEAPYVRGAFGHP